MKKKVIALLLATTMAFSLAACGGGNNQGGDNSSSQNGTEDTDNAGGGSEEKILSVQIGPDPETIDPALNSAVDGGNMLLHSFECLLTVGEDGQLTEGQAESWDTSEDGLTWTFHLRDGLKWSDGSDLTDRKSVV